MRTATLQEETMSIWQLRPLAWMSLLVLVLATPGLAATTDVDGEVFSLGEVIVTGEDQVVNLATTVTEVTAEDLKQRGARNLAEALELLPGVDVQRGSSKNESFVQIRGFSDQDVKILIDGVPVYEQYSRQLDLAQIPAGAIAKITVTKGASSVLYGANTLGGVINIITKKAGSKPTVTATTAWGDYDTEEYSLGLGAPIGKFNYWLGYSYRHSDGWRLSSKFDEEWWDGADDGGKRDNSDYLQHSFNAKVGFEPDPDNSLYLTFDYHDNEKGVPTRGWFYPEWRQWHVNLIGQKKVTDRLKIKARAFYADHDDTLFMTATSRRPASFSAYDNYSVGGSLHNFLDLGRWSFVKVGLSFQRDNCDQSEKTVGDSFWTDAGEFEADTYTFAVEDEIKPLDWLAFVFGASYDYYDPRKAGDQPVPDSIDSFNPQAGVVITLAETTTLHGSVGKKIRFPHLKELFSDMAGGNPDLDPQETITYEVGLTHAITDAVTLSAAAFYNDIEDLIDRIDVFDPVEGEDVPVYVNIGEAVTKGVEVALGAEITERFWAGINYTYMRTEDKDLDRELEGRPRHRANLDVRYSFPFGLTTSAQLSYTNRQFYEDSDRGWTRSPDFLLLNARAEQRLGEIWDVEGRVFVEASNLTDRDYYEVGRPTPGRNFLAGLNFTY
jgi:outer membrane receptor protein involved in Fe transport